MSSLSNTYTTELHSSSTTHTTAEAMEYEYGGEYCRRGHVPAFGSWDWNDAVPFTQCFETATTTHHLNTNPPPPGFLHYAPYSSLHPPDRDLYVAGDLYENHLVAPAMILLPRRRAKVGQEPATAAMGKRGSSKERQSWKAEMPAATVIKPKPVDEDLYKISPQILSAKSKRRRGGNGFGCFSRCFMPSEA